MTSYNRMRENMILGQFLPGLIKNATLLDTFRKIDREKYLPDGVRHMAYSDIHIKMSNNRYFVSPFALAKILEKANIESKEVVLLIGAGIGYESAILSKLSSTVMALEENISFYKQAEINLANNQIENVININGAFLKGCKKYAPYDKIIFLGSTNKSSEELLNQLSDFGQLLICENFEYNLDESKLVVYTKNKKKFYKENICDLNIPRLVFDYNDNSSFALEEN